MSKKTVWQETLAAPDYESVEIVYKDITPQRSRQSIVNQDVAR